MKAQKFTVTIVIEALSIDSVPSLASQAVEQIRNEMLHGELSASDGDQVIWDTNQKLVNL